MGTVDRVTYSIEGTADASAVARQVDRILSSARFGNAPNLQRLLRYIADQSLAGHGDRLKGYALGVDVLGRGVDFDPSSRIVSKTAQRLRERLEEYYEAEGAGDPLRINIPVGAYRMSWDVRPLAAVPVPAPAPPATRHNLPAEIGPLIGRDADLANLGALLLNPELRLVSVVGPGGMGKTRLAIEAARRALATSGETWFVGLDRLRDPALIPEAVLTALGAAVEGGRTATESLVRELRGRRALIVLDNAEHLLGEVARLALTLLTDGLGVRILVTSRAPLGLPDEQLFPIPALELPSETITGVTAAADNPAIALLVYRARASVPGFVLRDADVPVMAGICRRLDGIPLALELAAAWFKLLEPREVAAALAERIELLARTSHAVPERQRTLRATLDWSYALLDADEQGLFRRLSVFAGGWTLAAAEAVTGCAHHDCVERLASLVDKSLVVVEHGPRGTRYRFSETTRDYAAQLQAAANEPECERRLAEHMASVMARAAREFDQTPGTILLSRYAPEIDNLRVALSWAGGPDGDPLLLAELAGNSVQLLCDLGLINEARRWTDRARPHLDEFERPAVAAEVSLALAFRFATGVAATRETAETAVRAARRTGDPILLARCLLTSVQPLRFWSPAAAAAAVEEALAICRGRAESKTLAFALAAHSLSAALSGDHAAADRDMDEAMRLARLFDYRFLEPWAHVLRCECKVLAGDLKAAVAAGEDAVAASEASAIRAMTAVAGGGLAACLALRGETQASIRSATRALADADDVKEPVVTVGAVETLALSHPDPATAARLAGFADHARAVLQAQRRPSEGGVRARLAARLSAAFGEDCASLAAEGARLSETEAVRLALSGRS